MTTSPPIRLLLLGVCLLSWLCFAALSAQSLSSVEQDFLTSISQDLSSSKIDEKIIDARIRQSEREIKAQFEGRADLLLLVEIQRGNAYLLIDNAEKAKEVFSDCIQRAKAIQRQDLLVESLYRQGIAFNEDDQLEEGLLFLKEAEGLANQLDDKHRLAKVKSQIGSLYRERGQYDLAKATSLESVSLFESIDDKEGLGFAYNVVGRIYRSSSSYDTARVYYEKSLLFAQEFGKRRAEAIAVNNIGNMYHTTGDLSNALVHYLKSLAIKEELGNRRGIAASYHNIAAIHCDLEDYERALINFQKSMVISEELGYTNLSILNHQKIGNVFREQKEFEQAMHHHERAIEISKEANYITDLPESLLAYAVDFQELGNHQQALKVLFESLAVAEEIDKKRNVSLALIGICQSYMKLRSNNDEVVAAKQFSDDQLESTLLKANRMAEEIGDLANISASLEALQMFYERDRNFEKEANVARRYRVYKDSLFSQQRAKAIGQWESKYNLSEKEKEIVLLEKDKEIQSAKAAKVRARFFAGFIGLSLLGALTFTFNYFRNQIRQRRQMELMRSKISSDLHDDVGSILSGLAMQSEILAITAKTDDKMRLERIGRMSRDAMSHMRDMVWAIDSRKDKVQDLVDRMREFGEENLTENDIQFQVDTKNLKLQKVIPADVRQNLFLVFKEAVSNILKHSSASSCLVKLRNDETGFELSIEDNGQVEEKSYKTTGQGTSNMQMRAERIGGHIVINKDQGYKVRLRRAAL